jgi:hypothetical protein
MEPDTRVEVSVIPAPENFRPEIAPVWHTLLFLIMFALLSLGGSTRLAKSNATSHAHWPIYLETIVMQWLLILYVYWGLRLRGRRMREIIGGRWDSLEAVLTDVGIAIGFFFVNMAIRAALAAVILVFNKNIKAMSLEGMKHVAQTIGPQSMWELLLFMGVAVTAGICEEIMFRGYLQQQLIYWTRSTVIGVVLSAVIFAFGHLYQGAFLASQVGLLGLMLGILAAWRKSLRPGMIAHGAQDVISGLLTRLLFSGK